MGIVKPWKNLKAGVIAVVYSLIVEGLVLRTLSWQKVIDVFRGTALTTSSIFLVVATATALGQILLFYNLPTLLNWHHGFLQPCKTSACPRTMIMIPY